MRLGRRLSTGIAEDPPAPVPAEVPASVEAHEPVVALDTPDPRHAAVPGPRPARTPDPAVSGS